MKKTLLCLILIAFSQTAFAQTKFDEYEVLINDDEYSRLENFDLWLRKDATHTGTLIIYKDKSEPTGRFLRHFYGVKDFLREIFKVSPDKFSVIFGGENIRRTEIWLSSSKEEASKFENKFLDEMLAGKINRKTLFDYNCIDCDESPHINQFIFREGIDYLAEALKANPQTKAVIKVGGVEYLSKTSKERKDLLNQIFDGLQKKQIKRSKVYVRFTSGMLAKFYIIPENGKN